MWKKNLTLCNGRSLIFPPPRIIISSDASLQAWGGVEGRVGCHRLRTVGPWSIEEKKFHMNVLHVKGKECNISSNPHGQNDSPVILNENVGYQKRGVDCDQQRNLAMPFGELQRWICLPRGYHTSFPSTNPEMSTLSVRAGILFRYPGFTDLCMFFPRLHL